MVPVIPRAFLANKGLVVRLLWIVSVLGFMVLLPLLVGEQFSTLLERADKGFPLVHQKVFCEFILSGKSLGTLGTLVWP